MPDTNLPEIASKVRRIAATMLGVKPHELETKSLREAGADSVDCVSLIMQVENEFSVSIADLEIEGAGTVDEIAALVARKLGVAV